MHERRWTMGLLALALSTMPVAAQADATGSFDGQISGPKVVASIDVAAALSQVGKFASGTLALGGDGAIFGGAYLVNGKATPKRVSLSGVNTTGVTMRWRARISGDTIAGKVRMKGPGGRLNGTLVLARNAPVGDGSSCDAVYEANSATFATDVLGQALTGCPACHVTGGQAASTRLHVSSSDPLATARAIAALVDSGDAATARVVTKPLGLVPHGGGEQLVPGSAQATILHDWVALLVEAGCS